MKKIRDHLLPQRISQMFLIKHWVLFLFSYAWLSVSALGSEKDSIPEKVILKGRIISDQKRMKQELIQNGLVVVSNTRITRIYGESAIRDPGNYSVYDLPPGKEVLVHLLYRNKVWATEKVSTDSMATFRDLYLEFDRQNNSRILGKQNVKLAGKDNFVEVPVISVISQYADVYLKKHPDAASALLQKLHYMRIAGEWEVKQMIENGKHDKTKKTTPAIFTFFKDGTGTDIEGKTIFWKCRYLPLKPISAYNLKAVAEYMLTVDIAYKPDFSDHQKYAATFYGNGLEVVLSKESSSYQIMMIKKDPYGALTGTFTDTRDNQEYNWVAVGDQIWMAENLNTGEMISSRENQQNNGVIEKYCLQNRESSCDEYGGLYQWNEMMHYKTNENNQGICPAGWSLPTEEDWQQLADHLDGKKTAGGKLKSRRIVPDVHPRWSKPNFVDDENAGFEGLPAGLRTLTGNLNETYSVAYWWSSNQHSSEDAISIFVINSNPVLDQSVFKKEFGLGVRCIKD